MHYINSPIKAQPDEVIYSTDCYGMQLFDTITEAEAEQSEYREYWEGAVNIYAVQVIGGLVQDVGAKAVKVIRIVDGIEILLSRIQSEISEALAKAGLACVISRKGNTLSVVPLQEVISPTEGK